MASGRPSMIPALTCLGLAGCAEAAEALETQRVAEAAVARPAPGSAPSVSLAAAATGPAATGPAAPGRSPAVAEFLSMAPGPSPAASARGRSVPGDREGSADHPAVPRFEGATISFYSQKAFDTGEMFFAAFAREGDKGRASALLEGRRTDIRYEVPGNRSTLEIFRNYQAALKSAGYMTVFECERDACGLVASTFANSVRGTNVNNPARFFLAAFRPSDGTRLNLAVTAYGERPGISVRIMEPRAMEQAIALVDAAGIGRDVARAGKAVLYAIQFDTDKATLKPQSDAQLKQIADWLRASGSRALVVGHTDGQGAFQYNVGLSQRRAEAVVAALTTRFGVDRAKLTAFGAGMAAPIASNRTPDGQARNRRVEVVEQP